MEYLVIWKSGGKTVRSAAFSSRAAAAKILPKRDATIVRDSVLRQYVVHLQDAGK
jgi:hypothetical protein